MLQQSEGEAPSGASCGRVAPHTGLSSAGPARRGGHRHPRRLGQGRGTAGRGGSEQCEESVEAGVEAEMVVLPWSI